MINRFGALFLIFTASFAAWAAPDQFAIKESHRDSAGITFRTAGGAMRIEFCGDRAVHVVAGRAADLPTPKVPVVTQSCQAKAIQVGTETMKSGSRPRHSP